MTVLGQNNISTTLIGHTIGSASHNIGELCTSVNINKWSRYKPVRGVYPQAADGKYGINYDNLWDYVLPDGVYPDNGYRLGDFRQYEHNQANTLPPAYVKFSTSSFAQTDDYDPVFYPQINGQLILNDNGSAGTSEITLTDLGLENYYFGMYIKQAAHGQYHWKTMSTVATNAQVISATLFSDFPIGLSDDGSYNEVQFILSIEKKETWSNSAPAIWFRLPHETVNSILLTSLQEFGFRLWILAAGNNPASITQFGNNETTTKNTIELTSNITEDTQPFGGMHIASQPSWIDLDMWTTDVGGRAATETGFSPQSWWLKNVALTSGNGDLILRAVPNSVNTGVYRAENVILASQDNTELINILVSQEAGDPTIIRPTYCTDASTASMNTDEGVLSSSTYLTPTSISISYYMDTDSGWIHAEDFTITVTSNVDDTVVYEDLTNTVGTLSDVAHTVTLTTTTMVGGETYRVEFKKGTTACIGT